MSPTHNDISAVQWTINTLKNAGIRISPNLQNQLMVEWEKHVSQQSCQNIKDSDDIVQESENSEREDDDFMGYTEG